MKITQKNKKEIELEKDNNTIDNNLELIKYATEVQSRIKTDINSDYVLAVLDEKDKQAIIEMTNNAYLSKRMIKDITNKKIWKWNKTIKKWEQKEIDEETKNKIIIIAEEIFDMHMIRHEMKVIMERNKINNPILTGLMKTPSNAPEIDEQTEETIAKKLYNKVKKDKEKNEAET